MRNSPDIPPRARQDAYTRCQNVTWRRPAQGVRGPLTAAAPKGSAKSVDRDKDRMPNLSLDMLRQMSFTGRILDQDYLAGADHATLAVAGRYLHPDIEVDDVLPA